MKLRSFPPSIRENHPTKEIFHEIGVLFVFHRRIHRPEVLIDALGWLFHGHLQGAAPQQITIQNYEASLRSNSQEII